MLAFWGDNEALTARKYVTGFWKISPNVTFYIQIFTTK